jgi:hypothetical protein
MAVDHDNCIISMIDVILDLLPSVNTAVPTTKET